MKVNEIESLPVTPTVMADEITKKGEPTDKDIQARMETTGEIYYNARERLREQVYGGKPPDGFVSWGEYWKNY